MATSKKCFTYGLQNVDFIDVTTDTVLERYCWRVSTSAWFIYQILFSVFCIHILYCVKYMLFVLLCKIESTIYKSTPKMYPFVGDAPTARLLSLRQFTNINRANGTSSSSQPLGVATINNGESHSHNKITDIQYALYIRYPYHLYFQKNRPLRGEKRNFK